MFFLLLTIGIVISVVAKREVPLSHNDLERSTCESSTRAGLKKAQSGPTTTLGFKQGVSFYFLFASSNHLGLLLSALEKLLSDYGYLEGDLIREYSDLSALVALELSFLLIRAIHVHHIQDRAAGRDCSPSTSPSGTGHRPSASPCFARFACIRMRTFGIARLRRGAGCHPFLHRWDIALLRRHLGKDARCLQ